jgi:hypothetical protein
MTDASERERLIANLRETINGIPPGELDGDDFIEEAINMLRTDAQTIGELQHAAGVANQTIAAQSAELDRVRKRVEQAENAMRSAGNHFDDYFNATIAEDNAAIDAALAAQASASRGG